MSSSWDSVLLEEDKEQDDTQFPLALSISIIILAGISIAGLYAYKYPAKEITELDDIRNR